MIWLLYVAHLYMVFNKPWIKIRGITVISEYSGQSGGETPVPIPNTEVKPVNVLHCTKMCELSGTVESRYTHLFQFILFLYLISTNPKPSIVNNEM